MATFGFIGTGNMGGAIARAVCKAVSGEQVILSNRTPEKALTLAKELGCRTGDNAFVASHADFIFLGVKPQYMAALFQEIAPLLARRQERFVLVSMAAGLTLPKLQTLLGRDDPLIRIMPNTPSSVGEGVVFYDCGSEVTHGDKAAFLEAMAPCGRLVPLADSLMDAGSAVAGCGPAFADLFIEAIADGGVACGLSRQMALECAAQMLIGTGKLMLESGKHPAQLRDEVCSPGGATIQGVRVLAESGFHGAVMNAVIAAWQRSLELG